MKQKKGLLIILVVILVAILLAISCFVFLTNTRKSNGEIQGQQNTNTIEANNSLEDNIKLSLENESQNLDKVNIIIEVPDNAGNYTMILPDETTVDEPIKEYSVNKNGDYKFTFIFDDNKTIEKSINVANLKDSIAKDKPTYIPNGFAFKTGTIDTGYVIEDQYGNEFVWVPVDNGIVTRKNAKKASYKDEDNSATAFVNSVLNYNGYYISKYEASKAELDGKLVATSFYNVEPWNNVSFKDAQKYASDFCNSFGYNDVISGLTSSYAWDTTLNWLNHTQKSYSTSLDFGNYSETINNTGATEKDIVNNICDMAGNLNEWTTESFDENAADGENDDENQNETTTNTTNNNVASNTNENNVDGETIEDTIDVGIRILRGGSVGLEKPAASQMSFPGTNTENTWGFRIVLYK